jgi:hypothetical protein
MLSSCRTYSVTSGLMFCARKYIYSIFYVHIGLEVLTAAVMESCVFRDAMSVDFQRTARRCIPENGTLTCATSTIILNSADCRKVLSCLGRYSKAGTMQETNYLSCYDAQVPTRMDLSTRKFLSSDVALPHNEKANGHRFKPHAAKTRTNIVRFMQYTVHIWLNNTRKSKKTNRFYYKIDFKI